MEIFEMPGKHAIGMKLLDMDRSIGTSRSLPDIQLRQSEIAALEDYFKMCGVFHEPSPLGRDYQKGVRRCLSTMRSYLKSLTRDLQATNSSGYLM